MLLLPRMVLTTRRCRPPSRPGWAAARVGTRPGCAVVSATSTISTRSLRKVEQRPTHSHLSKDVFEIVSSTDEINAVRASTPHHCAGVEAGSLPPADYRISRLPRRSARRSVQ
jgi:hypothetical protein